MTVLVLGGAGYIGSHTVRELARRGAKVVVADNLLTGHRESVEKGVRLYEGDIRDRAFLDSVFGAESVSSVIHFAASSLVGESVELPLKYYNNNLYGTMVLLETMLAHGVKRIVFSSTAATYGEPERIPILENDRTVPESPYGETKLAMEKMFKWTDRAHDIRYVSLRYFNACGAHPDGDIGEDHKPETHLIPILLQVAGGTRERVDIFGDAYPTKDGTCVRDYIHVCDLADAHIRAMEYLEAGGASTICNLGNGVGFTVTEVLDAARRVTGHAIPSRVVVNRAGDPAQLVASNARAQEVLGFTPKQPDIEDIVASAWKWHKSHPRGFA